MAESKHEKFEYDSIKTKLVSLKENYTDYVNAVNKIDLILSSELKDNSNSAMFNIQGENIASLWDNYCSKIKGFLYVFEKWTDNIVQVYNNNIEFEEGNPDNVVIDEIDLDINPTTYSKEDIYPDSINYSTGYEEEINRIYQDYLDGKISAEEWNAYVEGLNNEQKEYATILSTGGLVVNSSDVESILNENLEKPKNMAEQIAENNKVPEGWNYVDLYGQDKMETDMFVDPVEVRMQQASSFTFWANNIDPNDEANNTYPVILNWEKDFDPETGTYIKAIPGEYGTEFELYRNGEFVKKLDAIGHIGGGSHEAEFYEIWNETYPNICYRQYSQEGESSYKSFKKNLETRYDEFTETGTFYLNDDNSVYYSGADGQIHYSDGSILQIYEDDLKWNLDFLFIHLGGKDNEAIKDIYMIANGYITYDLDPRFKSKGN